MAHPRNRIFHISSFPRALFFAICAGMLALMFLSSAVAETLYGTSDDDVLTNPSGETLDFIFAWEGDDDITNEGTINSNIYGGSDNDTITNSGTVSGSIIGNSGDDVITNIGVVEGNISGFDDYDEIYNYGTVSGSIYGNSGSSTIINYSIVEKDIHGGDGVDIITNQGTVGEDISAGGDDDEILNEGTVEGSIYGDDGNDIITNEGTIDIRIYGEDGNDEITNNGTVSFGIDGGDGDNSITNNGHTIFISTGSGNDTITNNDEVTLSISTSTGNDTIINNGTVQIIYGGKGDDIIINYDKITFRIDGDDGNDTFYNYGTMSCDLYAGNDDDVVYNYDRAKNIYGQGGEDTLYLGSGSTTTNTIKTFEYIYVLGPVSVNTLNLSGLYEIYMDMASPETMVTYTTLSNVQGDLIVTITGGAWEDGQTVNLFNAGSVSGFDSQSVIESSLLFDFSISDAQVTASRTTSFNQMMAGADSNIRAMASLLDDLAPGDDNGLDDLYSLLNFSAADGMEQTLRQLLPITNLARIGFDAQRMGSNAVLARMRQALFSSPPNQELALAAALTGQDAALDNEGRREDALENLRFLAALAAMTGSDETGIQAAMEAFHMANPDLATNSLTNLDIYLPGTGDAGPSLEQMLGDGLGIWTRALGSIFDQSAKDSDYAYHGWSYGLAAGLDCQLTDDFLAGIYGSWAHSILYYDDPGGSNASGDSWQLGVYGAYTRGDWFLEATAAWTLGTWYATRNMILAGTEYTADSISSSSGVNLSALTGMTFHLDDLAVTPVLGLEYAYTHDFPYSEQGADPFIMQMEATDRQSLRTMVGAELAYSIPIGTDGTLTLTPTVRAQWIHEYLGGEETTARFADLGELTVESSTPDRDTARLGLGLDLTGTNGVSGYLAYESDLSATATEHAFTLGIRYDF